MPTKRMTERTKSRDGLKAASFAVKAREGYIGLLEGRRRRRAVLLDCYIVSIGLECTRCSSSVSH